jgi:hypothetical protein
MFGVWFMVSGCRLCMVFWYLALRDIFASERFASSFQHGSPFAKRGWLCSTFPSCFHFSVQPIDAVFLCGSVELKPMRAWS